MLSHLKSYLFGGGAVTEEEQLNDADDVAQPCSNSAEEDEWVLVDSKGCFFYCFLFLLSFMQSFLKVKFKQIKSNDNRSFVIVGDVIDERTCFVSA